MSVLFDENFLKKLQNLVITTKIAVNSGTVGNRKSRSKGSSVEFSDYREYAAGDDFRRVDWNAFGRFEKLFVKLFIEEREAPVNIFLDTSKSMDWGEPNKTVASRRLAAALSYISLANYDRVYLACVSDGLNGALQSLRGRSSFGRVLDFLEKVEYGGTTNLGAALTKSGMGKQRGISILISDLFSKGKLKETIDYFQYRNQDIYICHILAPQEINPSLESSIRLVDSETGEFMDVSITPQLMKTYRKSFSDYISEIEGMCFKRGINYIRMNTSIPIEQMIKMVVERS
jgi:uncharacterized protein (DUF58 family)